MSNDSQYWDSAYKKILRGQDYDDLLAEHYRRTHLNLLSKLIGDKIYQGVLKTDLFAEALCPSRSFAWEMLSLFGKLYGTDISPYICRKAKEMAVSHSPINSLEVTTCDIRKLPFAGTSFDLIVSDSTLDHFKSREDINIALKELVRVLKPGGTLIVTLDNKSNITEPFFRLWLALGFSPLFIGKTFSMKELENALTQTEMSVTDKTTVIHNPRFFTRFIVAILRRISPGKADSRINRLLNYFDSLGNKRTKYLTAQFIAIKAIKPLNA